MIYLRCTLSFHHAYLELLHALSRPDATFRICLPPLVSRWPNADISHATRQTRSGKAGHEQLNGFDLFLISTITTREFLI